jgi:hypothetical protein
MTNDLGSFSFSHVPGGTYALTAHPIPRGSGERKEPKPTKLILQEGAKIDDVVIRVP